MTAPLIGLVEDNDHDHHAFARAFAEVGAMRRWSDGETFLASVADESDLLGGLDLLIVDLQLPGADGVEITRRVRALEGDGRDLPILVLTGSAAEDDILRALDAEATEYEVKPESVADLRALVARSTPLLRSHAD